MQHRDVMWQGDAFPEMEYASFDWDPLTISGHGVVLWQSTPAAFRYVIQTDAEGISRTFEAWTKKGGRERHVHLVRGDDGGWLRDGRKSEELRGCEDLDFALTPATNTLAIRRLNLRSGETARLTALWITSSDLEVKPLEQQYERIDAVTYRYISLISGFEALLTVDDAGIVVDYPGVWRQVR